MAAPTKTQVLHALFELLGGEVGKLQRHRGVAQETAGQRTGTSLRAFSPLEIEHPARQIAVRSVPESVDAEHLDIDTVFVHIRNARRRNRKAQDCPLAAARAGASNRVPLTMSSTAGTAQCA